MNTINNTQNKNKKIDTEEAKKIIRVFEYLHENNFTFWGWEGKDYYCLENLNSAKDDERYDKDFEIFKGALVCRLESLFKEEYLLKEESFIILKDKKDKYADKEKKLNLKEYLEVIKDSRGFSNYLLKLFELEKKKDCWIAFRIGELNTFCFEHFYITMLEINDSCLKQF